MKSTIYFSTPLVKDFSKISASFHTAVKYFASVFVARAYIDDLPNCPEVTASELFFRQIDRLLSGRKLCSEQRRRSLAFHA